jgi:Na+-transporting NADH:ubiquinone oxidoreductase subunit NqrF
MQTMRPGCMILLVSVLVMGLVILPACGGGGGAGDGQIRVGFAQKNGRFPIFRGACLCC